MSIFSINKIIVAGNATRDAELSYTPNGTAVAKFGIATSRSVKDPQKEGEYQNIPTFHNVVVWGRLAEVMSQQIKKGKLVMVEGRQENRSYETDQGEKRYVSEIVADKIVSPSTKASQQGEKPESPKEEDVVDVPDEGESPPF